MEVLENMVKLLGWELAGREGVLFGVCVGEMWRFEEDGGLGEHGEVVGLGVGG